MTAVLERAPAVWRAYAALATSSDKPGVTYSPRALFVARFLLGAPGRPVERVAAACELTPPAARRVLARLRGLGVAHRDAASGWHLSRAGVELVALIDAEGVV